jgi:hypothetical protein
MIFTHGSPIDKLKLKFNKLQNNTVTTGADANTNITFTVVENPKCAEPNFTEVTTDFIMMRLHLYHHYYQLHHLLLV